MIEVALICLALNVYHEARGETFEGKQAVASVTLNRVRDKRFPDTLCSVVYQTARRGRRTSCAFSWTCDGRSDNATGKAWTQSLDVAYGAIMHAFGDNTSGALWYHTLNAKPIWRTRLDGAREIGNHIFYNVRRTGTRF